MEKKENDVKFIVGIIILLVIFGVVGGSFWNLVAKQAEKDKQEEARLEQEAIRAIYVEAGDVLKEMVFVDMDKKTVFKADIPKEGIYNRNDKLIAGDTLENGDMVKVYGDGNMTKSIPASYPGVTKMKRNGRATQMDFFVETARRKTKSEISQAILYYSADFSVRGGITYPSAPSGTSQRLWACTDAGCTDKRNFEAGTGGRRSRFSG